MLVLLIDKVLLMLMFAAVLVTARHTYSFEHMSLQRKKTLLTIG
jgi:hypothetical protein